MIFSGGVGETAKTQMKSFSSPSILFCLGSFKQPQPISDQDGATNPETEPPDRTCVQQ